MRYQFSTCSLKIGQHKRLDTSVFMEVTLRQDDPFAAPVQENPNDYLGNVRVDGEFSFDTYPITSFDHYVKRNTPGLLTIREGNLTTKFNILIIEKNSEQNIVPKRIKRYFWHFCAIDKPTIDQLEIFPQWYKPTMNRVFYCTDFRGIWPVGVSALVVARGIVTAKEMLIKSLLEAGVNQPELAEMTLVEVDLNNPQALVLNAGTY